MSFVNALIEAQPPPKYYDEHALDEVPKPALIIN